MYKRSTMKNHSLMPCMKESLKRAMRVLRLVSLNSLSKEARSNILVETYENCREQGFAVMVIGLGPSMKLSFAENRNSDCMVLYVGTSSDFTKGNVPSEAVYRAGHYFSAEKGLRAGEQACARKVQQLVIEAANKAVADFAEAAKKRKEKTDPNSDYFTKVLDHGFTQWHMENDITHT